MARVERSNGGRSYRSENGGNRREGSAARPDVESGLQAESQVTRVQEKLGKAAQVVIAFEDVTYSVTLPSGKDKPILKNVTGVVHPGEMLALMGPSGSGKTTVLNFLAGRMRPGVTGRILYNGAPFTKPLKRKFGFVTQDDIVLATLTVRETLICSALLRLPKTLSRTEKMQRADEVIAELGLERCKDTIIGGAFKRGISGGERKRVCIGQEMLTNPSILFLDEPTSGLDSTTALKMVGLLRSLAKSGKCVISTIHQPSSPAFAMFDKLLLLCEGSPLYFGKADGAMQYFAEIGYQPKFATNPADFLLDLATGVTYESLPSVDSPGTGFRSPPDENAKEGNTKLQELKETLKEEYRKNWAAKGVNISSEVATNAGAGGSAWKKEWPTSWFEQFRVLLMRGVKSRRGEALELHRAAQVAVVSLVCGLLWWRLQVTTARTVQDKTGLLFFSTNFWGFFPIIGSVVTFPNERLILAKERAAGMYRLSAYFMARIVSDLPVVLALPSLSMGAVVYWMTGLKATFTAYILTVLSILLNVLVAQGLGLAVGAALMDAKSATTLSAVIMLTFLIAGGFFVQAMPMFIGWIKYVSFSYYVFRLLVKVQFSPSDTYQCGTADSPLATCPVEQSEALSSLSLGGGGLEAGALLFMFFFYRLLAYAFLRIRVKPLR